MPESPSIVAVECYAGYRGEETPRAFHLAGQRIEVDHVLHRWRTPGHRCFTVTGADGRRYVLRHDEAAGRWDATVDDRGKTESFP